MNIIRVHNNKAIIEHINDFYIKVRLIKKLTVINNIFFQILKC